jgi:alpha-N-acetylglucosamine transferase
VVFNMTQYESVLYLDSDIGFGLVHSLDMGLAAEAVASGHWQPETVESLALPARFGFVRSPGKARAG